MISTDLSCLEILLNFGANTEAEDESGYTPICFACESGLTKTVEMLVKRNANVNHANDCGHSPCYLAAQKGHLEIVKCLIDHGGCLNSKDVFIAADDGNLDLFNLMKDAGFDFNVSLEHAGYSSLHVACAWQSNEDPVYWLIDVAGVNINKLCNRGATPLHDAARWGRLNFVKILLSRGAEINIQAKDRCTPLDWAIDFGEEDVADFLKQNGAKRMQQMIPLQWLET